MSASQIILRDLADGRIEVAVMTTDPTSKSSRLSRWLLSELGEVADLRGIGAQLARGARMATDTIMIMSVSDSATLVEDAEDVNTAPRGASA